MSLAVRLRDDDQTPPYEQLRAQVATAIAAGELAPGSKLPPVRQLAGDLGVAVGTVARAYKELEQAGLVTTARRAGTTVVGHTGPSPAGALAGLTAEFVQRSRRLGVTDQAICDAVAQALRHAP